MSDFLLIVVMNINFFDWGHQYVYPNNQEISQSLDNVVFDRLSAT
jgi:hypothetical protein